jgi:hypothetical protein
VGFATGRNGRRIGEQAQSMLEISQIVDILRYFSRKP